MTFLEAEAAATVPVGEAVAMNDGELSQFMLKHRGPNGDYDLPIDGWEKLSKDERSELAERLEAQKRYPASSPMTYPQPFDLDELDARLHKVSRNNSLLIQPKAQDDDISETSTLQGMSSEAFMMERETEAYHQLVKEGGRPLYPIDRIQEVFRDPSSHTEVLQPWQRNIAPITAQSIFEYQLERWQEFRLWQYNNRGPDNDGAFLVYVERERYRMKQDCMGEEGAKSLAEIEANPSCLKSGWERDQFLRSQLGSLCREDGCKGFRDYAIAVKRRLAQHSFTQRFQLKKDPKKQDKLTTWIEYLNYEYCWLDKYTNDVKRLEPKRDRLWQELVDKGIPRPHETKEFVETTASAMEQQTEEDTAWMAVQRAESEAKKTYTLTQEDPRRFLIGKARRILMLKVGRENLLKARRRFEHIQGRNNHITVFIRSTLDYSGAIQDAACHRVLVRWVLDQVSPVEAEIGHHKGIRPRSYGRGGMKRRLATDEQPPERQNLKRRRSEHQGTSTVNTRVPSKATEPSIMMGQGAQPKHLTTGDSHQGVVRAVLQIPRRSTRIAIRRSALNNSYTKPDVVQPRSRSY